MSQNDKMGEIVDGVLLCGAKTRAGGKCRRRAVKGRRRCELHGGKSVPGGEGHHAWKHGRHSKFKTGEYLTQFIQQAESDPELMTLRGDVVTLHSLIKEKLAQIKIGPVTADMASELADLIEKKSKVLAAENKRLTDLEAVIPTDKFISMISRIMDAIREEIGDADTLRRLAGRIAAIGGRPVGIPRGNVVESGQAGDRAASDASRLCIESGPGPLAMSEAHSIDESEDHRDAAE